MDRECESCGNTFTAKTARHRFCKSTCRVAAHRSPAKTGRAAATKDAEAPPRTRGATGPPTQHPGSLTASVAAELTDLEAIDTVRGRAALALAYRIESPLETGSAAASMTVQLTRLMDEVKAAAAPKLRDGVDNLEEAVSGKLRLVSGGA